MGKEQSPCNTMANLTPGAQWEKRFYEKWISRLARTPLFWFMDTGIAVWASELVSVDQIKNNHQSVPRKRRVFLFCEQRNKLWNHCIPLCTNGLYSLRCPLFAPWNMSQPARQWSKPIEEGHRLAWSCMIIHCTRPVPLHPTIFHLLQANKIWKI